MASFSIEFPSFSASFKTQFGNVSLAVDRWSLAIIHPWQIDGHTDEQLIPIARMLLKYGRLKTEQKTNIMQNNIYLLHASLDLGFENTHHAILALCTKPSCW